MAECADLINSHYGQTDVSTRILTALQETGINIEALTRDDLAPFEELHLAGRNATRELAQLARLQAGMHVLDVGSGIGGPARTLAAEFACRVTGLDLTQEYVRAADILTARVGLSGSVSFHHGNALHMPFEDASFDVVWTQHASMNIADKERLFGEMRRVLQPDGRLVLHDIMAGRVSLLHFPNYWATDASFSFLMQPDAYRSLLLTSGFAELAWHDVTERSIEAVRRRMARRVQKGPQPLGQEVIVGTHLDVSELDTNMLRNLEEHRIMVIQGVFRCTK